MKKKFFVFGIVLILCLTFIVPPQKGFASGKSVVVTLPEFTVKLNGNKVDHQYREYPLLVYKDITYFPMTWYDCRLLGLETEWTQEEGLKIFQSKVTSSYVPYRSKQKNLKTYRVAIPTFNVTVNGRLIENEKEEYPLLSFNHIIYFPLTWKFAHDEYGWEYVWDDEEGLLIQSNNPQLKKVDLPEYAGANDVALFEGYYYFTETVGTTNKVYRSPEENTSIQEWVYSYEWDSIYTFQPYLKFHVRDGQLWFSYHMGGGVMGHDVYCRVNENGKVTKEFVGYLDFKNALDGTVIIGHYVPPGWNNLKFITTEKEMKDGKSIGDSNLVYGWYITVDEKGGRSYRGDTSTTVIGDTLYVLASSHPIKTGDLNNIYRIDLKTNETVKIVDSEVRNFIIVNDRIYYVKNADRYLYSSNLDGTNEQKLSDKKVASNYSWYAEINGKVYYTAEKAEGQFNLYRVELFGEDVLVLKEALERVQLVDDKIIYKLRPGEDYGVKILGQSGNLYLAITDQVSDVFAYNNEILIVSAEDKSIKRLK